MNVEFFVTVVQLSLMLLMTWGVGRGVQRIAPELSARISTLGLFAAGVIVLLGCTQIPRPYSLYCNWSQSSRDEEANTDSQRQSEFVSSESPSVVISMTTNSWRSWLRESKQMSVRALEQSLLTTANSRASQVVVRIAFVLGILAILRLACGTIAAVRLYRQSVVLPNFQWPQAAREIVLRSTRSHDVEIRMHVAIDSPCVHAFCRNVIFVPPEFLRWTDTEIATTIAHELAHLHRRDALWRLMGDVCMTSLAIHPLAYGVRRQAIMAQELSADRMAAQTLGSPTRYRQGLASLMLKFNSRSPSLGFQYGFGVGVSGFSSAGFSSALIRRIKMLDNSKLSSHSQRPTLTRAMTLGFTGLAILVGSWTLTADEPPRVAKLNTPDSGTKPQAAAPKLFSRDKSAPEFRQSSSVGYGKVFVAEAAEHPFVALYGTMIQGAANKMLEANGSPSMESFGLELLKIESIELAGAMDIAFKPENVAEGETGMTMSLGSSGGLITTAQPVDWEKLVLAIPKEQLAVFGEVDIESLAKQLGTTSQLDLFPKNETSDANTDATTADPSIERLWNKSAGGVVTMISRLPSIANLPDPKDDSLTEDQRSAITTLKAIGAVGVGVDFVSGEPAVHFQIIFCASAQTDAAELMAAYEAIKAKNFTELIEDPETPRAIVRIIETLDVEPSEDPVLGPILTVRGQFDPLLFMM